MACIVLHIDQSLTIYALYNGCSWPVTDNICHYDSYWRTTDNICPVLWLLFANHRQYMPCIIVHPLSCMFVLVVCLTGMMDYWLNNIHGKKGEKEQGGERNVCNVHCSPGSLLHVCSWANQCTWCWSKFASLSSKHFWRVTSSLIVFST